MLPFVVKEWSYMAYTLNKGVGRSQKKPRSVLSVTDDQWKDMLQAVEDSKDVNPNWQRDYAIIFLGAALGMRVGEIILLERRHFEDMDQYDVIHLPTLKQSEKVQFICRGTNVRGEPCGRKVRVKVSSAGKPHECYRCGHISEVPEPRSGNHSSSGVVEVDIEIVEPQTVGFILDYLANEMRPDQRFLFEGKKGYHLSSGHCNRIFNTYAGRAGLDPKISFHSLRHNRGVKVYSLFKDMVLCKQALRHKDVATTQIYADLDNEQRMRYREELSRKAFDPLKKRRSKNEA